MTYESILNEIELQSEKMLHAAHEQNWEEVITIEDTRNKLLKQLDTWSAENSNSVENKIRNLIDINQQLVELSQQEKENNVSEYHSLKARKKAVSAYLKY